MSKQFLAVIAIIILGFIGIFAISQHKSGSNSSTSSTTLTNHVEGVGKDNITLIEYGDYQCPYCGEAYPVLKQVQQEYNQQITFQFRNFPLVSLHQNAFAGARAAEAAAMQNKFWEMHDILYAQNQVYYSSNQSASTWINASDSTTFFSQYAQALGLNVTKFKQDYASTKVNDLINADMNEGTKLNITATPTFILDGKQLTVNKLDVPTFEKLINAEIAKKTPAAASSTPSTSATTPATH